MGGEKEEGVSVFVCEWDEAAAVVVIARTSHLGYKEQEPHT